MLKFLKGLFSKKKEEPVSPTVVEEVVLRDFVRVETTEQPIPLILSEPVKKPRVKKEKVEAPAEPKKRGRKPKATS